MKIISPVVAAVVLLSTSCAVTARTYSVGTGQRYETVSDVAQMLRSGDVVEVTSDITDSFILAANGTPDSPVILRGITRVEGGQIIRPRITFNKASQYPGIVLKGNWTVIEGLDLTGAKGSTFLSGTAICIGAGDITIRNCRIHHNRQGVFCLETPDVGNVSIQFCEFDSNGAPPPREKEGIQHSVYLAALRPGAKAVIEHCYFHDGTGGALLKTRYPLNVIRYNWFESGIDMLCLNGPLRGADTLCPCHSDIVGNVFDQGRSPAPGYALIRIGSDSPKGQGTEGNVSIAHNLFMTRSAVASVAGEPVALPGETYAVHVRSQGPVSAIRFYNNVVLEYGVPASAFIEAAQGFENAPRTERFRAGRGMTIEGASNWVSARTRLVPNGLRDTFTGKDPGFMDLEAYDYRPGSDSALAGNGTPKLPPGAAVSLCADSEPVRGIPADLKPIMRKDSAHPSIGPFSCAAMPAPKDGFAATLLAATSEWTVQTWPFPCGLYRGMAEDALSHGKPAAALEAARAEFVFCSTDPASLDAAMAMVEKALVALDSTDRRARDFREYALHGPTGRDAMTVVPDEKQNPLKDVSLSFLTESTDAYRAYDAALDARASVCATWEIKWYAVEKAFERLRGGSFDEGLRLMIAADADVWDWVRTNQMDSLKKGIIRNVRVGLSVVYRQRYGTMAGFSGFIDRAEEYFDYGPAGPDGKMGTADDLEPPI